MATGDQTNTLQQICYNFWSTKKKDFQVAVISKCGRQQMGLGQRILSNVFWELY
jgi:hypothetical protein